MEGGIDIERALGEVDDQAVRRHGVAMLETGIR
jgi:hypothetical protein